MTNIFEREKELFLPTYKRIPIEISHGEGVYLYDKKGNKYLDFFSGLAVNALGYADPEIISAVCSQIKKFAHLSNNFITDVQIEFAENLIKYSGMKGVFLSNSGTEAVEAAIKLIRKVKGPDKKLISFTGSFHGRTYGALTLTPKEKYQHGYEPLLSNVIYAEFNNIDDLKSKIDSNTAAVFIELIQGEGGIVPASEEFVNKIKELRKLFSFILVVDEIQTGTGRTGKPFAKDFYNINPDIIVTAKAIGGGLPLGAILVSSELNNVFATGNHGTTFGGNPVACAAGNVVFKKVFEEELIDKVYENGNYFINLLTELKNDFPKDVKEIRGRGFMIGVEHFYDCNHLVEKFRNRGVFVNCTNQNVIRILPPLITNKEHINIFIEAYRNILKERDN
ncbi:MAG TPA: acetylornithine/succinylornithine family transaminase [Ignavibacteriaceae bacterium]|nr:acetylornithine/succinylornithine family transaminase [Ignavibacteriaceae bacterium]